MVISAGLIHEEKSVQLSIYYVSHSMVLIETRYPSFEKLALALLVALQKLKPYFQAHSIIVLISHLLRQVLYRPEISGQLVRWSMELSQYEIHYLLKVAIKRQAMADFIAELTPNEEIKVL